MQREYTLMNTGPITLYVNHVAVPARGNAKVMLTLTRDQISLFNMKNVDVVFTTPDGVRYVNEQCLEIDRPIVETNHDKSDALNRMNMINHAVIATAELNAKIAKSDKVKLPPESLEAPQPNDTKVENGLRDAPPFLPTTPAANTVDVPAVPVLVAPTPVAPVVAPPALLIPTEKSSREPELDAMPWTEFKKLCKALKIENPNNALKRPALTALVLAAEAAKKGS